MSTIGLSILGSWDLFEGALFGSVTRWPLRERNKSNHRKIRSKLASVPPPQKKTGPKMHGCSAVGPPCPVYGHLIVSLELALLQLPRVHAEPLEHAQKQGTLLGAPVQNLIEDKESFRSLPLAQ